MADLVLSLFPGADVLGLGFEREGFCVVHARDFIFGGDVRTFRPPPDRFDGCLGGDPCQSHSSLANLVRAKGLEPKFPDLTEAFASVIEQAQPSWFLRENVPKAPDIKPQGYSVTSFLLDNCWLGEAQMRKRRFWFGWPEPGSGWNEGRGEAPNLFRWIETATFELPEAGPVTGEGRPNPRDRGDWVQGPDRPRTQAVSADSRTVPVRLGGSGKVKVTAVGGHDGTADAIGGYRKARDRAAKVVPGNGRHDGKVGTPDIDYSPPRRTVGEMLELQGLPPDWLDEAPFTMQAKRKLVGNAVPLPMARAIAKAVKEAIS